MLTLEIWSKSQSCRVIVLTLWTSIELDSDAMRTAMEETLGT